MRYSNQRGFKETDMTFNGTLQILLFSGIIILLTKPMGLYMARVFQGEKTLLSPILRPLEVVSYKLCGVDETEEMHWVTYAVAMLLFSLAGMLLTYVLLRYQGHLPLNPQHFGTKQMTPDLAFNTSASFTTNTNWQAYSPESTVSYFSNMVSLAIHNWMSAATGMAIAIALVRGLARKSAKSIGSFWVDTARATIYILLPICFVSSLVLIWQGVPQNFAPYVQAHTLEGATQSIPQGAVASQESIKMLGTNGGGIFNANSAHPYENPTPFTNFLQMISIFLIPAGLTYTFGRMVGNTRQGWAIFGAMGSLFLVGVFVCCHAEQGGNPMVAKLGVMTAATAGQPGGNMEGKETRFGITDSALFATITTDASCGAVNAMHDSFTPIGGLVPLANILSGEVIFGGVGAGLYGMLMFAIIAVFIAGLMVGRTPEYLGKKIEQYEVKMAMLATLILAASILGFTAIATNTHMHSKGYWNAPGDSWSNENNNGAHGFSEIFYAFASATGNNGSAFAGLNANTPFYNLTIGMAALIGRFLMIIPLLAIAGSMAKKIPVPATSGTFPTDSGTFVLLLVGTVVIVGALTFFPALALGPIVEHFQMMQRKLF